jgi:hypothetical protein
VSILFNIGGFVKVQQKGKIVRWVSQCSWGIVNFYIPGEEVPRKAFVHLSKVISAEKPQMGSRITFVLGPARSESELPQALQVEVSAPRPSTASLIDLLGVQS